MRASKLVFAANEKTWSNQRKKRRLLNKQNTETLESHENSKRKQVDDHEDNNELKKVKFDNCLVKCETEIKNLNGEIHLILKYLEGSSKDFMHQILQFIKNKIIQKYNILNI